MNLEYYNGNLYEGHQEICLKDSAIFIEKAHISAMREMINTEKPHVLYAITIYDENFNIEKKMIFRNTCLTDSELDDYIIKYPRALFDVIHAGSKLACKKILQRRNKRKIKPITLKLANDFVNKYHRHHNGTVGCKFAIGLYEDECLIGVAICGRPVSRYLDNGEICEINRCCTKGNINACSMLYGACCRIAKNMGYEKIITYTLKSESGVTLKASNFKCEGEAGGKRWTGIRNKERNTPNEKKIRWSKILTG